MPDTATEVTDVSSRALGARRLKFNAVGVVGIAVQLSVLAALTKRLVFGYRAATALAVEAAVLHNFVWHERWTWRERTHSSHNRRSVLARPARFHLASSVTSMLSNLIWMRVLVGYFGAPVVIANLAAIAATAIINFVLIEWFVFRER